MAFWMPRPAMTKSHFRERGQNPRAVKYAKTVVRRKKRAIPRQLAPLQQDARSSERKPPRRVAAGYGGYSRGAPTKIMFGAMTLGDVAAGPAVS